MPEHLADTAAFWLATRLRAANVTGLQWQQVDLARQMAWVHPDQAKARRAIAVPLNNEPMAIVRKPNERASALSRALDVLIGRAAIEPATTD